MYFRWHILRSHHFVAEVTFKNKIFNLLEAPNKQNCGKTKTFCGSYYLLFQY